MIVCRSAYTFTKSHFIVYTAADETTTAAAAIASKLAKVLPFLSPIPTYRNVAPRTAVYSTNLWYITYTRENMVDRRNSVHI